MTTYNKNKTGGLLADQLQTEINAHVGIVPSCTSIVSRSGALTLEFAAALATTGSPSEEDILDQLILDHVPEVEDISLSELPLSDLDGLKLAVHTSYKPTIPGVTSYAVWTGAGDDLAAAECDSNGTGELLSFNVPYGTPVVTKDIKFDPRHGRVWIHEAYMKFEEGGIPDYLTADIMAPATPLQTAVDKVLVVDGDGWVTYATGSPAPTHGFGGTPLLIPRTFAQDGDWDYSEESGLVPNFAGTGEYKINSQETAVSRYVNRIPCYGSTSNYFTMSSDETAELPVALGFFIRINAHNISNTNWHVSIFMELYRQRTVCP